MSVDDDVERQQFIIESLEELAYPLKVVAVSPSEALRTLETGHFDCVLSGFFSPEIDRLELAETVKRKHKIPLLVYTANKNATLEPGTATFAVYGYVLKGVSFGGIQRLAESIFLSVKKNGFERIFLKHVRILPEYPQVKVYGRSIVIDWGDGRVEDWGEEDHGRASEVAGEMELELKASRYVRNRLRRHLGEITDELVDLNLPHGIINDALYSGYRDLAADFIALDRGMSFPLHPAGST